MLSKVLVMLVLFFSFGQGKLIFEKEKDKINWASDIEGCKGYRMELFPIVSLRCKGLERSQILGELGKPNKVSEDSTVYYYNVSSNCENDKIEERLNFIIEFKSDTVIFKGSNVFGG